MKNQLHASDTALSGPVREAAYVGREIAAFNRAATTLGTHDVQEGRALVARLLLAPASTPLDALALAATARSLMPWIMANAVPLDEGEDDMLLHCLNSLVEKTVEVLEHCADAPAATFTGTAPALN